jgi:hypothetical protein
LRNQKALRVTFNSGPSRSQIVLRPDPPTNIDVKTRVTNARNGGIRVSECDLVEAAKKLNVRSLLPFRLKAEATRQTVTGLPRRSGVAAKAGTIRAQWSPIAVPA